MISDPRQYTHAYPRTNVVIDKALQVLDKKVPISELDISIANNLQKENDALINVALNLSPSSEVCQVVWDSLNRVINSDENESFANIFAIPLILIAGSKTRVKLKSHIDVNVLNLLFTETGIFKSGFDCFISGKLIEPSKVAAIKPSQIYYWVRNLKNAKLWLPIEIEGSGIEVFNEGVFLRFLIGVSVDSKVESGFDTIKCKNKLMEIMQLINSELQNEGVTLFSMPFAAVPLSEAFAIGAAYRTEIALSVAISNIVRKIREQQFTPVATISVEGEAVKIIVKSKEQADLVETSLFNMTKFASFEMVMQTITSLLNDIGVEFSYVKNTD